MSLTETENTEEKQVWEKKMMSQILNTRTLEYPWGTQGPYLEVTPETLKLRPEKGLEVETEEPSRWGQELWPRT